MVKEGQSSVNHRHGDARSGRGASCGWVNMDLARLCLLWALISFYMLFGAIVFSALERPEELRARSRWDAQVAEFAHSHQVSPEDIRTFLKQYEEANTAGVKADPRRPRWDFSGSFYFVATVVSTIGTKTFPLSVDRIHEKWRERDMLDRQIDRVHLKHFAC